MRARRGGMHGRTGMLTVVVVLAGCAALGGATTTGAPTASATPGAAASRAASAAPTPTMPPGVARVFDIGEPIWGVVSAGKTVWVEGDLRLHHLDGATGAVLQTIPGWWPTVIGETLWYIRDDKLVEADATAGTERAVYSPGVIGTTVHEGVLWADDEQAGTLLAIELASNDRLHELELPPGEAKWVEVWEDAIWTVIDGSNVVLRVDLDSGKVLSTTPAGSRPHSVATGFGSLWVTDHGSADVQRFAPDGSLEATIHGPGVNVGIAATGDSIWSAAPTGVIEIDPSTNKTAREINLGRGEWYGMAYSLGFIWLTSAGGGRLYQIPVE